MNTEYLLPVIVLVIMVSLIVFGIRKLIKWTGRVVDKQQEISMIKAQAMKTAAENMKNQNNSDN